MGNKGTKQPPPKPDFDKPWRNMTWTDRKDTVEELRKFKPGNTKLETLKILLVGSPGAGKSSFINSINNIFQGHITTEAIADDIGGLNFTKIYKTFYIEDRSSPGSKSSFAFIDTMGLNGSGGITLDVIKALRGHVKEGYKFNVATPLSEGDPHYNKSPRLGDQVHCLVTVVAADQVSIMDSKVVEKLRELRLTASDIGIPQVVLLTKVDIACELVKEDLKKVYTSKYVKEQMQKCSSKLGMPMNCILPVMNYHNEIDLQNDLDELLLKALKQIVNFADDYVRKLPCKNENVF
ncbi:hypothetical protein AAFF_G00398310 [Aldrovandia affinis]|uniref:G domain-containing protein n=1 Tax=Aldrovandia affinis TaxID=143900 RepID=A0AAD7WKE2_9TELE|nr:hypothetical protein AAFF_G00398310 [Aldrovandia affinis]